MKLILGTAQFGQIYGISNPKECVPPSEVRAIIDFAEKNGLNTFDTAASYGDSHRIIGQVSSTDSAVARRIISKVRFSTDVESPQSFDLSAFCRRSMNDLHVSKLYGLLLHDPNDFACKQKWAALRLVRDQGLVEKIGISAYCPEDILKFHSIQELDLIQIPLNLLDTRWGSEEIQRLKAKSQNIEIHVRSLFLQGLLIDTNAVWPKNIEHKRAGILKNLDFLCLKFSISPLDLCIRYVRSLNWVDGAVVGVYNQPQLQSILNGFRALPLSSPEVEEVNHLLSKTELAVIDPRLWSR